MLDSPQVGTLGAADRLRLYIAGASAKSAWAIEALTNIYFNGLEDAFDLEIIDLYQMPDLGGRDAIVATPTLVITTARATRRIVTAFLDRDHLRSAILAAAS